MAYQDTRSLAGESATILIDGAQEIPVVFGNDVSLKWASGRNIESTEEPALHPEITGHMKTKADYSYIKDAELILDDQTVFRITFNGPTLFQAREPISSRTRVI
jgi:hypothetical protein